MSFKEVQDLDCDTTVSLGGVNKKTGKANPKSVEGFYVGRRQVEDRKKKSGFSYIYVFETPKGKVGVWGKTDMDRKMTAATPGALTRISFDKMRATANGDMYVYKVEIDEDQKLDLGLQAANGVSEQSESSSADSDNGYALDAEEDTLEEETPADEVSPARTASRAPAPSPSKTAQTSVQDLLKRRQAANRA